MHIIGSSLSVATGIVQPSWSQQFSSRASVDTTLVRNGAMDFICSSINSLPPHTLTSNNRSTMNNISYLVPYILLYIPMYCVYCTVWNISMLQYHVYSTEQSCNCRYCRLQCVSDQSTMYSPIHTPAVAGTPLYNTCYLVTYIHTCMYDAYNMYDIHGPG